MEKSGQNWARVGESGHKLTRVGKIEVIVGMSGHPLLSARMIILSAMSQLPRVNDDV